jgi:hypothetical protein
MPTKIKQHWDFGHEKIPSGNPEGLHSFSFVAERFSENIFFDKKNQIAPVVGSIPAGGQGVYIAMLLLVTRVTRLGEFSPIGRLLTLDSFI